MLLLDLPGAGGSGVNADPHVSYELWEQEDFRIVESALRHLSGLVVCQVGQSTGKELEIA